MRRLVRLWFLIPVLAILLLGPTPAGFAAELRKFVMGYSTVGAMAAGMWMAKEIGAYEKYGIDAELIYISSGPTVVQALLGGDVVGGIAATNAVISAVLRGAPLVSVLSTCNRPYHRLWVQPEIKTFDDLKGKVLGVTRFGSVTDNLTRMILKKYGLENSVQVRQMGGIIEVSAAFQNKQIAGAVTSTLRVDEKTQPRLLAKLEDMGFEYSMDVIAHSRDDLKKFPNYVEGMVRAYIEGVAAMHFQKERANRAIAKYAHLSDQGKIDEIYQDSVVYLEKTPRVEPGSVNSILNFMGKRGVPLETFADNSIVDKLVREKFVERLYKK
ncbi:MAG TPA: ABC transporter substrate-binding protein [Candidatus Binatia bacterium]|jgi:ABC-type nitrate/sulfonate/bicarbonate transport system substrate-binding protein